jgi:hypothetical protein
MIEDRDLEGLAPRLGRRRAGEVDPEATATAVVGRLRSERSVVHWWRLPAARRMVAAAVLILAAGLFVARSGPDRPVGQVLVPVPVVLDELAAAELVEIIDSLDVDGPVYELVPASLHDLSERQLERLLENMEG